MNAQEQKILDQIVYELKDPKDADNLCKKGYGYLFFEKGEGVWKGQNLLHFYKDNADMIDWLIQHGLNVNEADANGRTPLFLLTSTMMLYAFCLKTALISML